MDFGDAALVSDLTDLHRVPPPMIQGARAMLDAVAAAAASEGDEEQTTRAGRDTTVYVGGPLPGVCRLCGVDR